MLWPTEEPLLSSILSPWPF